MCLEKSDVVCCTLSGAGSQPILEVVMRIPGFKFDAVIIGTCVCVCARVGGWVSVWVSVWVCVCMCEGKGESVRMNVYVCVCVSASSRTVPSFHSYQLQFSLILFAAIVPLLHHTHSSDRNILHSIHFFSSDEAAQAVEPSTLIPFKFNPHRVVMVGDPCQLPATVFSRVAKDANYGQSLFQVLRLKIVIL